MYIYIFTLSRITKLDSQAHKQHTIHTVYAYRWDIYIYEYKYMYVYMHDFVYVYIRITKYIHIFRSTQPYRQFYLSCLLIFFIDISFSIESQTHTPRRKNTKKSQMLSNNKHLMHLLTIFSIDIILTNWSWYKEIQQSNYNSQMGFFFLLRHTYISYLYSPYWFVYYIHVKLIIQFFVVHKYSIKNTI